MGTPAELKQQFDDRLDRRAVRPAGAALDRCGCAGGRRHERARRSAAQGGLPHPARSPDADRDHRAADPAGDHLRLRDSHRRRPRAAGDRRSLARSGDAGAARALRGRRRLRAGGDAAAHRAARGSVQTRRGAGGGRVRGRLRRTAGARPAGGRADHRRRDRAEHRQPSSQAYAAAVVAGLPAATRAPPGGAVAHRAQRAHALQPDPRELEPLRARPDGVRADASSRR